MGFLMCLASHLERTKIKPSSLTDEPIRLPVVLGLEVADADEPGAGADGELVLVRGPFHARGGTVDPGTRGFVKNTGFKVFSVLSQ